jgi:pimeloyl-ACP methyl ester carboxylesterase
MTHAADDDPPLNLARDGFFYVGGKPTTINGKTYIAGQMYVEMRIPAKQTHPYPIIMVHGGTRSGTNWTGTPDGREGWAQYFARRGYAVYVVDQPGRGRSAYVPEVYGLPRFADAESAQRRYMQQEKFKLWPQAHLHTQWPGSGEIDDPATG